MPTRQLYADEETYQLVGHAYKNIAKEPVRLNELKFYIKMDNWYGLTWEEHL